MITVPLVLKPLRDAPVKKIQVVLTTVYTSARCKVVCSPRSKSLKFGDMPVKSAAFFVRLAHVYSSFSPAYRSCLHEQIIS